MDKKESNKHREKMVAYKSLIRFSMVVLILVFGLFAGFIDEENSFLLRIAGIVLFIVYLVLSLRKFESIEDRKNLLQVVASTKVSLIVLSFLGLLVSLIGMNRNLNASADEVISFLILVSIIIFFVSYLINRKAFK